MSRHHRKLLRRLRELAAPRGVCVTLCRTRWGWAVDSSIGHTCATNRRADALQMALGDARTGLWWSP